MINFRGLRFWGIFKNILFYLGVVRLLVLIVRMFFGLLGFKIVLEIVGGGKMGRGK